MVVGMLGFLKTIHSNRLQTTQIHSSDSSVTAATLQGQDGRHKRHLFYRYGLCFFFFSSFIKHFLLWSACLGVFQPKISIVSGTTGKHTKSRVNPTMITI